MLDYSYNIPNLLVNQVSYKSYNHGEQILVEGDQGVGIWLLEKGRCKIYTSSPTGQKIIQNIVSAPEVFGMIELFKGHKNACTVEAYGSAQVAFVPTKIFMKWLKMDHEFTLLMLEKVCDIAHMQIEKQSTNLLYPLKYRLLSWIIQQAELFKSNEVYFDKQILAQELATTVRHLNRTIAECEKVGFIEYGDARVTICDWTALIAYKDVV